MQEGNIYENSEERNDIYENQEPEIDIYELVFLLLLSVFNISDMRLQISCLVMLHKL